MTTQVTTVLEELRDADGLLRIEAVVASATDPTSPLHDYFEWDDAVASHRYRLGQARTLIRAQKISVRIGPAIIRTVAYVPQSNGTGAYRPLSEITPQSDLARQVMLNELTRVSGALGRARNIAAVLHLESEIDDLLSALAALRDRAVVAAPAPAPAAA